MSNSFPVLFFIWLLVWLFKEEKKEVTPEVHFIPEVEKHPIWKVMHISNGKLLSNRHLFYYCEMLQLPGSTQITDECIEQAAFFRQSLLSKIDEGEIQPYSRKDIATARAYLMDRWLYMTSLN